MKLLFNSDISIAQEEFKEVVGFTDAEFRFSAVLPEISNESFDMLKFLEEEIYNDCITAYELEDQTPASIQFVQLVRYPIFLKAFINIAATLDVQHTLNGRSKKLSTHEQMPYQWMIDKDDKNLESLHQKSLDRLIDYLSINHSVNWKKTKSYISLQNLCIRSAEEFDVHFNIGGSRLLLLKLAPGIKRCQDYEIRPRIGKDLLNSLLDNPETDIELFNKIQSAVVSFSMSWAMGRLSVSLFPEGVLQSFISDRLTINSKRPALGNESSSAAHHFNSDAAQTFLDIEKYMRLKTAVESEIVPIIKSAIAKGSEDNKYLSF